MRADNLLFFQAAQGHHRLHLVKLLLAGIYLSTTDIHDCFSQ